MVKNRRLFAALLSKGYLPRELPLTFTSLDFGASAEEIVAEWESSGIFVKQNSKKKLNGKRKAKCYSYKLRSTEAEIITKPKKGYERRALHITHPVPQALLSREIAEGWKSVQSWLSRQSYSLDAVEVSGEYDRALKEISFLAHRERIAYLHSASDWLVSTDISRFYPSIYTHSIPWAAYGKKKVKEALDVYEGTLADRLDVLVRACNRNQTIGIPIGPETSRIIAEIISARIDSEFSQSRQKIPRDRIDRLQDDWQIGTSSLAQAEAVLAEISKIYSTFGLEINGSKTNIERINLARDVDWKIEISNFLAHRPGQMKGARLRSFLDLAVKHQSGSENSSVGNYVLAVLEGQDFDDDDVPILESFLLRLAFTSPGSLDRICRIILNLSHYTKKISKKRVADRFVQLIDHYIDRDHRFEVIWLLTALRGLKRPVNLKRLCEIAPHLESSAVILTLLDMQDKKLGIGKLPISTWIDNATEERTESDWCWLYAYEGIRNGWLDDKYDLMSKRFFRPMRSRGVIFYDPSKNVITSTAANRRSRAIRKAQQAELRKMFMILRGGAAPGYWA